MRRLLFVLASIIAVLTFSCDTTQPEFDDTVPGVNTLTTTVSPEEGGEVFPSDGEFVDGTSIEIEAVPNTGYVFDRWEGDLVGSLNPTFLSMTENRSVTAFFSNIDVPLTINVIGQGSVSQEILNQDQDKDQAALTATTIIKTEESADNLKLNPVGQIQKLQRDGNRAIDGAGSGSERERPNLPDERIEQTQIPQQRAETRQQKAITTLKLTAIPDEGWQFSRWEGDLNGTQNPDTLVVEDETVVTVVFEQDVAGIYTLVLTVEGQGFIEAVPDKLEYTAGEEVTLTATAENGWRFSEWRGDLSGSQNPETIIMDSDKQVSSIFVMEGATGMEIVQQPSQTVAGEIISPAPAVRFNNSNDEPLEGIEIQASLSSESFSGSSVTTVSTDTDGIARFEQLSIETAGQNYNINFEALDSNVTSLSTTGFTVVSASGDPESSSVSVNDGISGEPTAIDITIDDRFGNPVSGVENDIEVTVTGANSASPGVSAGTGVGQYIAEYTPQNIGVDQISVELNGTAVAGSPVESIVTASDVSGENSLAEISPDEVTVGQDAVITVTARDNQNNPLSGIEDEIQLTGIGDASVSAFSEDNNTGIYTATVSSTDPGQLSITVTVSGVTLEPVLIVTFLSGSADTIEIVSGNNQSAGVANTLSNSIVVRVLDAFENQVEGETVTFEFDETPAGAAGQSVTPETVTTNTEGEASSTVQLGILPGTYTITASAGSAGSVTFTAQADLGQASVISIISQPSNTTAGESISPSPSVEITDDEGNGIEGIAVNAVLSDGGFADGSVLQTETNGSGIAQFDNLSITVAGSEYSIQFEPDASSLSDITSDPFTITSAGGDPASSAADVPNGAAGDQTDITITVLDEFGNPVEGIASDLSLAINQGVNSGAAFTDVSDEGNGTYQAGYTPSATGTDEIVIELNGIAIEGSPFIRDVVATDAENIVITEQPQNSTAGEIIGGEPAVFVTDDLDNAISGVEVTVSVDGGADLAGGTSVLTTNVSGIAVFDDLVIRSSGSFQLRFNALGVTDDAVSESFTISPAAFDALIEVSGNDQSAAVNEELSSPFIVRTVDAFGNPVAGETVEFSISDTPAGASGASLSTESVVTNSSGEASSTLTLGSATGAYTVTASSGAGSVQFVANANAGEAVSFEFDQISSPQIAGSPFVISLTAFDSEGNIVESYSGTATLSSTAGAVSPSSVSFTNGDGSANVSVSQTGNGRTLTAVDGDISGTSNVFDVVAGSASQAEIGQQPTETTAGQAISPAPSVLVEDSEGNPVEGVDVSVSTSGGSITAGSETAVTTNSSGLALFDNIVIETAGSYTLSFDVAASGVTPEESGTFEIVAAAGDPDQSDASVQDGAAGEVTQITITVEDEFGNRVLGVANLLSVEISGANSASPSVTESGDGIYSASYTPLASGTDQVEITLDGTPISRSPYTSIVTTSDISGSESSVAASPTSIEVGNSSQVTVELRDANGNAIAGLINSDFDITVSGNASAGAVSEISPAGTYRFNVSNTRAELVTVSVKASGVTLDDTPQITFTPGAPDLVVITSQPENSVAGQVINGSPAVRVADEFGNSISGLDVTVTEQDGQEFADGTETVSTDGSGVAQFNDLVINNTGRYNLVFLATPSLAVTSNAFNVNPGNPDADETTATVPNGAAGDETNIIITVRDDFENRVEGVADQLSVSIGGENAGASVASIQDEGDGVYSTSYTPTSTGSDEVTIELNGDDIEDSPYTSEVITSEADEIVIRQDALQTVAGEPIEGPPSIEVLDDLGNPVRDVEVVVSLEGSALFDEGTTTLNTKRRGEAEFDDLVIETAGTYTLIFNAIGVSENAESGPFNVVAADAESLSLVSGNNQSGTVTNALVNPFVVRVTDSFGNPVSGTSVEFAVSDTPSGANGQEMSSGEVVTGSDGLASATLTLGDIAGTYVVTASAGGLGSATFSATANAAAASSFAFDQISSPQTAGQPFSIRIIALDNQGNTATGYRGTADLTTNNGSISPVEAAFSNGIVTLDVSLSTAANNQSITATDGSITSTSNTFDVQSGGVDAANSSVSVDPATLQAGQNSALTIELRDGSNNLVSGIGSGDFTISLTGDAEAGSVNEVTSGVYSVDVSNQTAETVAVTVEVNGVMINDSPTIEFTPADADEIAIVSGDNQSGAVTEQLSGDFIIQVTDAFDNSVANEQVEFSISGTPAGATGHTLSSSTVQTDNAGNAATRLTLGDTPGEYLVEASVTDVGTVIFTAEAETGAATQMTIVTQPENTRAGQSVSPSPQVRLTDGAGNAVGGVSITVREESGYNFDGGTLTQTTSALGIAVFDDLVIESSGRYKLVFDASASGVPDVSSDAFNVNPGVGNAESSTLEVPDGTAGEETEINIRVEDEFGNAVNNAESDLSVSVTGANTVSPAVNFSGEAGEYAAFYTPLNSGDDNVEATLDGVELSNSPQISVVSSSDVSASESIVQADPETLQVGNDSRVTIEVKDGSGNSIAGLSGSEFSIDVSGEGTADPVNETNVSGIYEFNVNNTTAQPVTVATTVSGVTLDDTPQIEFTPGNANSMAITTQPGNAVAGEPISGPPAVSIEDEFNNPVPGVEVTVTEQSGQTFESGVLTVETNTSGVAEFSSLVITAARQYNLVFSANGVTTLTSNEFSISPADADPAFTTANVPNGAATDFTSITITVEDPFGNRVTGVSGDLTVSVDGANSDATVDPISPDGNGIYSTGYTPSTVGTDEITITLGGVGIEGSPYESVVVTSEAETVVVETQPLQTVAGQPIAGPPAARVTDSGGNNVSGVEVIAGLQSGTYDGGAKSVTADGSGIAAFSDLVINTVGSYVMVFNAVGVTEDASSEPFDIIAAAPANLVIDSGSNQTATVTQALASPFVVQITDEFGNAVEAEEVSFAISGTPDGATGQNLSAATGQTDGDGFVSTQFTLGSATGTYEVTASADGLDAVTFTSTATAGNAASFAFESIGSPQVAGALFEVTIGAFDSQGNVASGYNGTATLSSSAGTVSPSAATFSSGDAVFEVSVSTAGAGQTLSAQDGVITGTSNGFDVQSGGVDSANSSVAASPVTLQAGQPSTLTIDLRDGSNNVVSGVDAGSFAISLTGSSTAGPVTESTAGTYTSTITNETAEVVTASVTVNGTLLGDTPQIEFTPADADPAVTRATVPNGAAGDATAVTISVDDEFGNAVTGVAADLSIAVTAGPNVGESFTGIADNSDGTYTASYIPQDIGTDEVTITLDGTGIAGSPYSSEVIASDVNASNSSATANPTSLIVGNASTVTVVLRDGSDNPIAGLLSSDFDITPTGSANASTVSETVTVGTYEFTVSNQVAESVTVTITATGTTLQDIPSITFMAAGPASITVSTQPDDVVAGEVISGPPTVTLEDQFDNPVPNIDVTVSEQGGQSFASGTLTVQTDASGVADFTDLVISTAGEYNLVFSETGGETATSNIFNVSPAGADAASSTASVPNGAATDVTSITITVEDPFGNPVTGVANDLGVSVGGANSGTPTDPITDDGNGSYLTGYTPSTVGTDEITITLGGVGIAGSPYESEVVTSEAETVVVETQPLQTVAGQPIAGPPAARVTDSGDNNVPDVEVIAGLQSGAFDSGTTSVNTDGSGIAAFTDLVINTTGSYIMEFNAVGVSENASSQLFEIVAADAANLVIDSGNNQTATVTDPLSAPLVVEVTDAFGNPVEGEEISFAITNTPSGATGQSLSAASVTSDVDGLASVTLTTGNASGDYQVTASGTGIGSVIFTATADAGQATAFAFDTIASPQTAGAGFTVSLTAQDGEGNTAADYSGTATLTTTAGTITPSTADFTSGTASVNVTVIDAGAAQTITAEDGVITGTSNTFDVQSGGVDGSNSSASADPATLQAGQSSTLTIDVLDGSNNAVVGLADTDFTISPSGDAAAGTVSETSSGIYTTEITNETAQVVTVSVTVDGTALVDTPQIEFTAGSVAAITLVSGDNQTGTVAQQLAADFVVAAQDAFGNPVSGVQVDFAIDQTPPGATGQTLTNTQIQTGSLGQAFTRLTLGDTPGTYTADASVSGIGTITFTAQATIGEASLMTVSTQPGETTAGNTIVPAPAVTITDDVGNAIEDVNVNVSEQGGYTFDSGTLSAVTDANGIAVFSDLVINTASSYTLEFDADAAEVANSTSNPFDVVAAAGDPSNTTASVPDGAAGDPTTVSVTVLDQYNNAVTGVSGNLSVSVVSGPNTTESFGSITDSGNGTYTTTYTPQTIGTDGISILLSGTAITGSPYSSDVTTSDVSASNSTVTATPETLQAGNNSLVSVEVRDGSSNPISGLVSGDFSISVSGDGSAGTISETSTDGTYQFNVANTTAEQVSVSVTATGTTLQDSPTITFTAADPDLMLITQQPGLSAAGQPIAGSPTARVTDEFGNRVPDVEVSIAEQGGEPFAAGSTSTLNTNSLGQAIFDNIAIEQAGQYNLVFSAAGVTNRTSNIFDVEASDAVASQTTATVPNGSAGVRTQISITVRDAFGNRVEGASVSIGVGISGANDGSSLEGIVDNGDGVYSTGYTPQSTGIDQVAIDISGTVIPGSPFASEVTTSDADNVALSQQPLETVAGNSIAGAPSAVVTDQFGNNVAGIEVTVRESGGADFDAGTLTVTSNASGAAVFSDLQINTAGTYTLIFDAVGVELDATSDTFSVIPASGDAASTVASAPAGTAGESTEITATVEDIYGNRVEGVATDVSMSVSSGPNAGASVSSITSQGSGVYTAFYTPTATGTDEITVTLFGVAVSNSPALSAVSSAAAATLEILQQPGNSTAGSTITPAPATVARDSEGNGVPGVDVTATLSTNVFTVASTTTVTTDSNGLATFGNLVVDTEDTGYTIAFDADAGVADITSNSFDVSASTASAIEEVSGNSQAGEVSTQLTEPFVVRVVDDFGNAIADEDVTFTITTVPGGASGQTLTASTVTTNADGLATTTLTLGDTAGTYSVDASFNSVIVTFTAEANNPI